MSIAKAIAKAPILAYKYVISPLKVPSCRFEPTCSTYALEAVEKHGAVKGLWLAIKRIARCNPWCKCDYHDPVP